MTIYPAIDLKDGKAVRLTKGVMESAKVYSDEPYHLARAFEEMGSDWVHIVDLNGAFAGNPMNLDAIKKIREATTLKLQLGGGIRDEDTIKRYIEIFLNGTFQLSYVAVYLICQYSVILVTLEESANLSLHSASKQWT